MIRIHSGKNVLQAAYDRIEWLFDEFVAKGLPLGVSTSGGKDSTVVYEITRQIAKDRGYELPVMWLDQECEFESTVEYVRWQMHEPGIKNYWFQVPFRLFNTTDPNEEWLHVWDVDHPERWVREKEPDSWHENTFGVDRFKKVLDEIGNQHFHGGALLVGMRTEEAPNRRLGLTARANYKWVTWATNMRTGSYRFNPIYDWSWRDVWFAIHDNGWNYNTHYDLLYQHGTPLQQMRVSNYHHETAVWSLFRLQEIEPETYARATARLSGIHTAAHLGSKDFFPVELPFMFDNWVDYRDHLVKHLLAPHNQEKMLKLFARYRKTYPLAYEALPVDMARAEVHEVIANDWECIRLSRIFMNLPDHLKVHPPTVEDSEQEGERVTVSAP